MKVLRFALYVSGIASLNILIAYLIVHFFIPEAHFPAALSAVLVGYVPTLIAYTIVYSGIERKFQLFVGFLLTAMLAKLLIGMASVAIIALFFKEYVVEYIITYFFAYFIFTAFEVYSLMLKLRPQLQKSAEKS